MFRARCGAERLVRYNPATRDDMIVPCQCANALKCGTIIAVRKAGYYPGNSRHERKFSPSLLCAVCCMLYNKLLAGIYSQFACVVWAGGHPKENEDPKEEISHSRARSLIISLFAGLAQKDSNMVGRA